MTISYRASAQCLSEPVTFARARGAPNEFLSLSLTHCDGRPNLSVLRGLSLLARPKGVGLGKALSGRAAARPRMLDAGLLIRLQAIARQFPRRTIQIVSGHRPGARHSSRHRVGRALDIRVSGVDRRHVAAFAMRLPATGVGYYPNSSFTHVDVRARGTFWIDESGPGEAPRYVRVVSTEAARR